ncbi:MAG: dCTP deaminase [Thermodesulfobacteriota bacterium]
MARYEKQERKNITFWFDGDYKERLSEILPLAEQDDFSEKDFSWVQNPDSKLIQPSSLELSLGKEVFISSRKDLYLLNDKDKHITIPPGDFALLITREYIKIPNNCMAFISIKSKYKFKGLINISGFHVDPGFEGKLKFSVFNAGTTGLILSYGDPVFILFITYIQGETKKNTCEHNRQRHIDAKDMEPLIGAQIPLHELAHRLRDVETKIKIFGGALGGILIALIASLLSWLVFGYPKR